MLNEALDRIHGWGAPSEPAKAVATRLDKADVRAAALIHLAALFESAPDPVEGETVVIAGVAVRLVPSADPSAAIWYKDIGAGFDVVGANLVRRNGPDTLADLLWLFQFSRDHTDTLLYLPRAMRDQRIREMGELTGAGERFVRYLLTHYPSLSAKVSG